MRVRRLAMRLLELRPRHIGTALLVSGVCACADAEALGPHDAMMHAAEGTGAGGSTLQAAALRVVALHEGAIVARVVSSGMGSRELAAWEPRTRPVHDGARTAPPSRRVARDSLDSTRDHRADSLAAVTSSAAARGRPLRLRGAPCIFDCCWAGIVAPCVLGRAGPRCDGVAPRGGTRAPAPWWWAWRDQLAVGAPSDPTSARPLVCALEHCRRSRDSRPFDLTLLSYRADEAHSCRPPAGQWCWRFAALSDAGR